MDSTKQWSSRSGNDENRGFVEETRDPKNNDIECRLRNWAIEENVTHKQLNRLLKELKDFFPKLPIDSRTLLKTTRKVPTIKMMSARNTNGGFIYFGIEQGLRRELMKGVINVMGGHNNHLNLIFNIDGLPLHKSTSSQLWPICGMILNERKKLDVFDVAFYNGDSKPNDLNEFLQSFIEEIKILLKNGLIFEDTHYSIGLKGFICDAPARSYLKCIKSHNSVDGCEFCTIKGRRRNFRILFNGSGEPPVRRTNALFRLQKYTQHQQSMSPLLSIDNFDIIEGFPLDYMHMACLGTMRRLLNYWMKSTSGFSIAPSLRKEVSKRIVSIKLTKDFNRKTRSLVELDRFKASELRTILLYLGPFILHKLLPSRNYKHFLYLHCAMRICCSEYYLKCFGDKAIILIKHFIEQSEHIYLDHEPVYNTHSLLHLIENAVMKQETLEGINCFTFENHLGQLKKLLRTPNKPLEQLYKRIKEKSASDDLYHENNALRIVSRDSRIHSIAYKNYEIIPHGQDSYVLLKCKKIMKVEDIIEKEKEYFLRGCVFQEMRDIYSSPLESSLIGAWAVEKLSTHLFTVLLAEVRSKCVFVQVEENQFVLTLVHSES